MSLIAMFDRGITSSVQAWPAWVKPVMSSASAAGDPIAVGVVASSAFISFRIVNDKRIAMTFVWAIVGIMLSSLLKMFLHRTRPDTLYVTMMRFKSYSFPSGHTFGSTVTYGLLGYQALKHMALPFGILILAGFFTMIIIIGISRVYLGAHFPSDVIGGWLLGAIWLSLIINVVL
jgi:undecaprenyl-diphosphatase